MWWGFFCCPEDHGHFGDRLVVLGDADSSVAGAPPVTQRAHREGNGHALSSWRQEVGVQDMRDPPVGNSSQACYQPLRGELPTE